MFLIFIAWIIAARTGIRQRYDRYARILKYIETFAVCYRPVFEHDCMLSLAELGVSRVISSDDAVISRKIGDVVRGVKSVRTSLFLQKLDQV